MVDSELGDERLGGLLAELLERLRVPGNHSSRRLFARGGFALTPMAALASVALFVFDQILGRLTDNTASIVKALAPGTTGDLFEVAY